MSGQTMWMPAKSHQMYSEKINSTLRLKPQGCDYLCQMQFRSVVGQEDVKNRLLQSSSEGRVSHALLFFGPPGSGVLPMSIAFAQYLNCEQPGEHDSCGQCGACRRASKLEHPDIHFVYPVVTGIVKHPRSIDFVADWRKAVIDNPYMSLNDWIDSLTGGDAKSRQGNIPVEEAQDIIHKLNLKAFEGRFKVFIVWMPEKMGPATANKLLKSLEEPPADTVFILASEARDQLMATILSRTQLVKLNRLSESEIAGALMDHQGIAQAEAFELARLSDGNYNQAAALAESERGGGSYEDAFLDWMRLCFNPLKSTEKLLAWVDGVASGSREQQKQFLSACINLVRECLLVNLADGPLVRLNPAQRVSVQKFLPFVSLQNAEPFISTLSEGIFHLERNAHAKILFLDLSMKISAVLQRK
jgi:DNA polymerase-3 subunit delta'